MFQVRVAGLLRAVVFAGMALGASAAIAAEERDATSLLFATPYLEQVAPDHKLVYDYERQNEKPEMFGQELKDTITLEVTADKEGSQKRTAMLKIYSGPRERQIGPLYKSSGNPAVMVLLEQDTFELQRQTGGQPAYFRNMIRRALRDSAKVEATSFQFGGQTVEGHKVVIAPYAGDANMQRVPDLQKTVYEFVVADVVPGGIYSVSAMIPGEGGDAKPLKKNIMTFKEEAPL